MTSVTAERDSRIQWTGGIALTAFLGLWLAAMGGRPPVPTGTDTALVRPPESAWLGMQLVDGGRVVVREVAPASPAALAGLQPGDVLVAVEDQLMVTAAQVADTLAAGAPETPRQVEVLRSGSYLVLALGR